jgi:hypothetical protein
MGYSAIPFSRFSGFLKSLRTSLFDDAATTAVEFAFPLFFETPVSNARESKEWFRNAGREIEGSQEPYRYRRFAGDSSLLRDRYYTVCDDLEGNDKMTLFYELMAYYEPGKAGALIPFDGLDTEERDKVVRVFSIDVSKFVAQAINLVFIDDDRDTLTPVFRTDVILKDENNLAVVSLPYGVEQKTIDNVIDLRLPATHAWFTKNVLSHLPKTLYVYDDAYVASLHIGRSRPKSPKESDVEEIKADGPLGKTVVWAPAAGWNGEVLLGPENFFGLLPYLTFPHLGGSPITEAIGAWLRRLGANGLVYPSARNDLAVIITNGVMTRSGGWNFVDYRDSPPPEDVGRMIYEPDSWSYLEEGSEPEFAADQSGSWRFIGRSQSTAEVFRSKQLALMNQMEGFYRENQWPS